MFEQQDKKQNKLISTNSDYIGSNDANIKLATTTRFHDAIFNPPKDASTANTTASTLKQQHLLEFLLQHLKIKMQDLIE